MWYKWYLFNSPIVLANRGRFFKQSPRFLTLVSSHGLYKVLHHDPVHPFSCHGKAYEF